MWQVTQSLVATRQVAIALPALCFAGGGALWHRKQAES